MDSLYTPVDAPPSPCAPRAPRGAPCAPLPFRKGTPSPRPRPARPHHGAKRRKPADETLTVALARLLEKTILPDLADRAKTPAVAAVLREQHAHEKDNRRTADPFEEWAPRPR